VKFSPKRRVFCNLPPFTHAPKQNANENFTREDIFKKIKSGIFHCFLLEQKHSPISGGLK
jgi:hypothetical protein